MTYQILWIWYGFEGGATCKKKKTYMGVPINIHTRPLIRACSLAGQERWGCACASPHESYQATCPQPGGGMSCQGDPLANHLGPILMWTRASSSQPWHSGCAGLWVGAHWNLKAPFKNKGVSYHPPAHEWSRSMQYPFLSPQKCDLKINKNKK